MKHSTTIPMTHSGTETKVGELKMLHKNLFLEFKKDQMGIWDKNYVHL
jgi:hypothetical protein